jgi:hypothetical protein
MERTDIWFDLHVGEVTCSDDGVRKYLSTNCSKQQLTALDIKTVAQYRDELHRRLDAAIDMIDSDLHIIAQ